MSREEFLRSIAPEPAREQLEHEVQQAFAGGTVRRAIGLLDISLARDPRAAWAWKTKSEFLTRLGFHDRAVRILAHACALLPDTALRASFANTLTQAGRLVEAAGVYRGLLPNVSTEERRWVESQLAKVEARLDPNATRALHRKAITLDPKCGKPYLDLVRWLIEIGCRDEALETITEGLAAIDRGSATGELLEERSYIYSEERRTKDALRAADEALRLNRESLRAHYLRGRALGNLGRLKAALAEVDYILALAPEYPDAVRASALLRDAIGRRPWWQFWG